MIICISYINSCHIVWETMPERQNDGKRPKRQSDGKRGNNAFLKRTLGQEELSS